MESLLYKGAQVFVQGKLKKGSYKGKDKVERQSLEITATIIQLLDKTKKAEEQTEKEEDNGK
jgi:single-stranded DNA-binding protein